jgi:hypothetical protein
VDRGRIYGRIPEYVAVFCLFYESLAINSDLVKDVLESKRSRMKPLGFKVQTTVIPEATSV